MLDILDALAVREAVARQPLIRREICELLMCNCTQDEVAEALGISRGTVSYYIAAIRWSFIRMGFEPPRRRRYATLAEQARRRARRRRRRRRPAVFST